MANVLPAASLRFVVPGQPAAGALDEDLFETPRANPMVDAMTFLPWNIPAAAGNVSVQRSLLQGILLAACKLDSASAPDVTSLRAANLLEQ